MHKLKQWFVAVLFEQLSKNETYEKMVVHIWFVRLCENYKEKYPIYI